MSWVAPLSAMTARMAIVMAKKSGRWSAKATKAKPMPETNWVRTTKNFFVLYISRNGLHRGFSVHGSMMSEVQKAICASLTPMPLYMSVQTMFRTTKDMPMAK